MVFEGDDDVITTPLEAHRLHRGIENSELFVIKDAGHFPWLEQPATFFKECSGVHITTVMITTVMTVVFGQFTLRHALAL